METGREMDTERSKKINRMEGKKGGNKGKKTEEKEGRGEERKKEERRQRRLPGEKSK